MVIIDTISDKIYSVQDTIGGIIYPVQYVYNSKNLLITRIRYDDVYSIYDFSRDIDNINYDSNNRINEISTYDRVRGYTAIKTYEYNGSSILPTKINRYRVENDGSSKLTTEKLTYNNEEKLVKVTRTYTNTENNNLETTYTYHSSGNLAEIKSSAIGEYIEQVSIATFENYDTQRNPFKELPFSDLRGISESDNNYMEYSKTSTVYSEQNPNGTIRESSGYSIMPTDLSYLEKSLYQCDE